MKNARLQMLISLLTVVAVVLPFAAKADPILTVTGPAPGSTFSRSLETIPVTGTVSFDAPVPAVRRFLFRRDGCGATDVPANTRLSTLSGTDSGACGSLIGLVGGTTQYPAENGLPLVLDAETPAAVEVVTESDLGLGIGNQQVSVTLTGRTTAGATQTIGSGTQTLLITPGTDSTTYRFNIVIAPETAGITFETLNAALRVAGGQSSGYVAYGGASFIDLPIMDAGTVQVSSDSASFSPTRTVDAVLASDGTWTAAVGTPSTGSRRLYVRAVQGTVKVNAEPIPVTIVP